MVTGVRAVGQSGPRRRRQLAGILKGKRGARYRTRSAAVSRRSCTGNARLWGRRRRKEERAAAVFERVGTAGRLGQLNLSGSRKHGVHPVGSNFRRAARCTAFDTRFSWMTMGRKKQKTPRRQGFAGFCWTALYCSKQLYGAQERTRTSTMLPPLGPEPSASTNSATWARFACCDAKTAIVACLKRLSTQFLRWR